MAELDQMIPPSLNNDKSQKVLEQQSIEDEDLLADEFEAAMEQAETDW